MAKPPREESCEFSTGGSTPGVSSASCRKSRRFSGSSWMRDSSSTMPNSALSVARGFAPAVTSTVSVRRPTGSTKSTPGWEFTCTATPRCEAVWKFAASAARS